MDKIYLVFINADSTEGRGPTILDIEAGFFTDINQAANYTSKLPGVQGLLGARGGAEIREVRKHDEELETKKLKLTCQIEHAKAQYRELTGKDYSV